MIPGELMVLDEFPLTPNGKIDRKALPAPDGSSLFRREYEAPEGELEEALSGIWQDLLHVEKISRWDNFFDLGGHSLLAVQLVSRIEQRSIENTELEEPVRPASDLSDLAGELLISEDHEHIALTRVDRDLPIPLSWSQQRLWFIAQLDEQASMVYNLPTSVSLTGALKSIGT